jgi:hypothetical protein
MRKPLWLGAASLLIGMTTVTLVAQNRDASEGMRDRFVGAWRLAWLEEEGADGKIRRVDCTGLLVYTRDGHMSVQVMYRNQQSNSQAATSAAPTQYAQGGYEASYGRYEIDKSNRTFTFQVEGALVRAFVGKDLPRAFEFSGKQLIVKSTHPEEHWRVALEHY